MNKRKPMKNPNLNMVYCGRCGERFHRSLALAKNQAKGMGHTCKVKKSKK